MNSPISPCSVLEHHVLAGEPFTTAIAVNDVTAVVDISRLDDLDTVIFIQTHRVLQLGFVVGDGARGLVVADQSDTPLPSISDDRAQVEIRIRSGEAEALAVRGPIAIPALVPALHQHCVKAVLRREIHVALDAAGVGPVPWATFPGGFVEMHFPPDTHELSRLEPGHIPELVGLIEIELDTAVGEELRENLGGGLRRSRHSRVIRSI